MPNHDDRSTDAARWSAVDHYLVDLLSPPESRPAAALAENAASGLPKIDVSATQGKMLGLFVRMTKASRVLEIGTLGGYSTIWMAGALADGGKLVTIEVSERHAAVARKNVERAGLGDRVEIRVGAALDVLRSLEGPFDLIFIDADKVNYPGYLREALRLSRPGTVIIGDNVVRGGAVIDPDSGDPNVRGVREFLQIMAKEPRLSGTVIQTVGEKGWDGFALAVVGRG